MALTNAGSLWLTGKTLGVILGRMKLGEVIRRWRRNSDVGLREAAREIGVSHGTLSRIERGEEMDAKTLIKVLAWLFSEV